MLKELGRFGLKFAMAAFALSASMHATAANVNCNNCDEMQTYWLALGQGPGAHLIFDVPNVSLTKWRVLKDRETGMLEATPMPVSPDLLQAYQNRVNAIITANANLTIVLRPDEMPAFPFNLIGSNPLNGYGGFDAYDLVGSVSLRNSFGTRIADWWSGANDPVAGGLFPVMTSIMTGGLIPGIDPLTVTIRLVWTDGSSTTFVLQPGQTDRAEYQVGESRDGNDNRIPDASIHDPETASEFNGDFIFNNEHDLERWVNQLQLMGIPIVGAPSGRLRLSCVSVANGEFQCSYH